MSLRYKALIAVVLLVATLTGFLVVSSSQMFEADARERINSELLKDQRILDDRITAASRIASSGMRASLVSSQLAIVWQDERINLGENLASFANEWLEDVDANFALVAADTFVVKEVRGGVPLAPAGDKLSFIAFAGSSDAGAEHEKKLLSDPELIGFISRFYDATYDAKPGETIPDTTAAVLPVAGRVYLVVQNYMWENVQDKLVIGVGLVMVELSDDWLKSTATDGFDTIDKLVFAGDIAASTTLDDLGDAQLILESAVQSGAVRDDGARENYEFEFGGARQIGIAFSSSLSPKGTPNRPGFIAFKNLDNELARFKELRQSVFLIGAGLGLIAAALAYFGAYLVISKLRMLELATGRIREGAFDTRVNIRGRDELAKLGKAFNDMTTGLKALGMYTHETLAKSVLDNAELLGTTSTRVEGSIFFSDIKGFTSISEGLSAEALTSQLNEYFTALGDALRESRGYIDKFIGDSVMAFWGPPFIKEGDYALRACETALTSFKVAAKLRDKWKAEGRPLFFQRIGIATGDVVVGNIGTQTKKNFTVIGDSVNLASRLEGTNKLYGTEILVDERTYDLAKKFVIFREVDQILVIGKNRPVRVFEPLTLVGSETAVYANEYQAYEAALKHYRAREFTQAMVLLEGFLKVKPQDGPSQWLLENCRKLAAHVDPDWQPVTTATSK